MKVKRKVTNPMLKSPVYCQPIRFLEDIYLYKEVSLKKILPLSLLYILLIASCAPGTDLTGQVSTTMPDALTQTAIPTATSLPVVFTSQIAYQSSNMGIQFNYPGSWNIQELSNEQVPTIVLSTFDAGHPPQKSERTDQTVFIQFSFIALVTPPESFEAWVESNKQAIPALGLSVLSDERFSIASQPAANLILSSDAGDILHHVLTELNGHYVRITIDGNYDLARVALASIQPFLSEGVKPADSETPAAGICSEPAGDPANIFLGNEPGGLPVGGRCVVINPAQRIKLINLSNDPFNIRFAEYSINLPVGNELLLNKPVGEYLALGVHYLPMAPALWVKTASAPTEQPPLGIYENKEVGYRLTLPANWVVDEASLLAGSNKEVVFYPNDEPFIVYLSIGLDDRSLEQIRTLYAESVPEAIREDMVFSGQPALEYTYSYGRVEYYVPFENRLFLIISDKPQDGVVQQMLASIMFLPITVNQHKTQWEVFP